MTKKPYKFNGIKRAQWLKQYHKTGSITAACQSIGISTPTVYEAFKKDKDFNSRKIAIDNLVDDTVENRLHTLTKTSPVACFFWLCNRRKSEWKNIQKMEHSGSVGVTLVIDKNDAKL